MTDVTRAGLEKVTIPEVFLEWGGHSIGTAIQASLPHHFRVCLSQQCVNSTQDWKTSLER